MEDEVETPEFPDEVGFIFSPRKASTCTSDEEAISANEKANVLPEFSRTPGIKTFHKDGFHDFESARLDGENTWSVVSKEAKALVHLNENALCSSSSQPTCKANKSGKDLLNVFEVFIPQLHLYHNPYSLLNGEAVGVITQLYYSYSKSERRSSFSI